MSAVSHVPHTEGHVRYRKAGLVVEAVQDTRESKEEQNPQSETPSEEDYDENVQQRLTQTTKQEPQQNIAAEDIENGGVDITRNDSGIHIPTEGRDIQEALRQSSRRLKDKARHHNSRQFRDLVFSHKLSAFDPNNHEAANSPFHGFYNLFWLAVALFVCKISANNWRTHGNPLGPSDIMNTMFSRDGIVHRPNNSSHPLTVRSCRIITIRRAHVRIYWGYLVATESHLSRIYYLGHLGLDIATRKCTTD